MSKQLSLSSEPAVNEETYSTQCLPKVIAFIKKYHGKEDVVFYTEPAWGHYGKRSLEEMDWLKLYVVP